jgi:hypothetical protein
MPHGRRSGASRHNCHELGHAINLQEYIGVSNHTRVGRQNRIRSVMRVLVMDVNLGGMKCG